MTDSNIGNASGPLSGLRVLDLKSYLAQHCARALGDMGADVPGVWHTIAFRETPS